jgi:superfamily II DNA or RNA helicase
LKTLYPVQQKHADVLVQAITKHQSALDASETGTGKTIVAASIAANVDNPTLVVAPKALLPMWRRELKAAGANVKGVINYESLRRGCEYGNWHGPYWRWDVHPDTFIIFDEVQKCKAPNSLNSKILLAAKAQFVLALSATAAESPAEMRALGFVLGLHKLLNWWPWARERGCYVNHWGHLEFNDDVDQLDALHKEIFPEHGHRLRVADMADHFTETQIITTPLDFGPQVKKLYAEMEKELADLAEKMESDHCGPSAAALVATLRARQSVELCKVPLMLEMMEDLQREGRSVVVFVNFDATIEALRERSDYTCCIVRGGQSEQQREDMVEAFQSNRVTLMLCNLQAGGLGLNLQDLHGGHPRTSIISPSFSAFDVLQAIGRIHRAEGQTDTQQHILFAAGTIEERVERVVRRKIDNISILNDGKELTT